MASKQSKPISRPVAIILRSIILLCVVSTATMIALHFMPGLAILPFANGAKSPFCSAWQAVHDADVKVRQGELQKEIHSKVRHLRTEAGYKLWSTPSGEFWVPDTSDEIIEILLAQQKRSIYGDSTNGGVRAGDIVLDGGAHVGTYIRTALDAGAEKVVAIEPSPEALVCLRRNFVREVASGRVVIYPKGIWDTEKTLTFYANGNGAAGDGFLEHAPNAKVVAEVPVTTVDKIVSELGLARVDLIKADIKGAGTQMIAGAVRTIERFHPRIVVSVEESPEDPASIKAAVMRVSPNYRFRCGPCLFTGGEIRNDTIFFQ